MPEGVRPTERVPGVPQVGSQPERERARREQTPPKPKRPEPEPSPPPDDAEPHLIDVEA